nr:sn-glycerol-3-phosphate ABC transporter ATP-binding protein UgpC [uncultured Roseateles sp.]
MARVTLDAVGKRYGAVPVLNQVTLDIQDGEFVVLLGPSGCGKSTLLRMLSGLESISEGTLSIDGQRVNDLPPADRGIAMVFQSYALYPHLNVYKNMAFGLQQRVKDKVAMRERILATAAKLRIEHLLERLPRELSGGQRQRVAIGRAIVRQPRLFLFDEPLSNLDAELRLQTRAEIARLHRELGITTVYVTHDQTEAMTLGDRIVVLHGGRVQQAGAPLELYERPANRFVAGFLGSPAMNMLPLTVLRQQGQQLSLGWPGRGELNFQVSAPTLGLGDTVELGLRPEHLRLQGGDGLLELCGEVDLLERLGDSTLVHLIRLRGFEHLPSLRVVARLGAHERPRPGELLTLHIDPAHAQLFAPDGSACR